MTTNKSSQSVFVSVRAVVLALFVTSVIGCGGGGGGGGSQFAGSFSGTGSASAGATTIESAWTMQVSAQGALTVKTTTPSGPVTLSGSVSDSGDATATVTSGPDTGTLTGKFETIPGGVTCSGTLTATSGTVTYTGTWSGARYTGPNPLTGSFSGTATVEQPSGPDETATLSGTITADGTMTVQVLSPGGTYSGTGTCDVNGEACMVVIIPSYANDYFYGTFTLVGSTLTGSGHHQLWTGGTAPSFTGNWSFTGQKT